MTQTQDRGADTSALFEPFAFGRTTLPSRIVMAPMTRYWSPGGTPGPDVAAYYRRRAEGGVGLIISEGAWINHHASSNGEPAPNFYGEKALAGWRHILSEVRAAGGRMIPQLWHTGLVRRPPEDMMGDQPAEDYSTKVSPSGYALPGQKVGDAMPIAEAEAIINAYAEGAETAERLGFDGVEIHGAHGYLVDQFFWHETNTRDDRFGGDLRTRTAFGVEMIRACRARVSQNFPISLRVSQWKLQDYNAKPMPTPRDLETFLLPLAEAGVDIFHASQRRFWQPEFEGSHLNLAGWAKKITGKPSITVGSVGLAKDAVEASTSNENTGVARIDAAIEMLERGEVDLVAVGRALIADPNWSKKIRRSAYEDIHPYNRAALATLT